LVRGPTVRCNRPSYLGKNWLLSGISTFSLSDVFKSAQKRVPMRFYLTGHCTQYEIRIFTIKSTTFYFQNGCFVVLSEGIGIRKWQRMGGTKKVVDGIVERA